MEVLPDEIWMCIIEFLPLKSMIKFSQCCKHSNKLSKSVKKWSGIRSCSMNSFYSRYPASVDQVKSWPNIAFMINLYYPKGMGKIGDNSLYLSYGYLPNVYFSIHKYKLDKTFILPDLKKIYSLEYSIRDEDFLIEDRKVSHISITSNRMDMVEKKPPVPKYGLSIRYSNISSLHRYSNLTHISLIFCERLTDIRPLKNIKNIVIVYCNFISDISCLGSQHSLRINGCERIRNFDTLGNIPTLDLSYSIVTGLSFLGKGVKKLTLRECLFFDLENISGAENIEELDISQCNQVSDISCLKNLKNLKVLEMRGCSLIRDISCLQNLKKLEILDISRTQIESLEGLKSLVAYDDNDDEKKLKILKMHDCDNIGNIPPIFSKIYIFK